MSPGASGGSLRVASYNLKDLALDRAAAARVVRQIDPDVLCLQEVPRRLFSTWRVSSFAAECGMSWSGRHRGSGGTTIFTSPRVHVAQSQHVRLAVPAMRRTRGYAVTLVGPAGHQPLVVASIHLGLDPAERERHAGQILAAVASGGPVVLAGDVNEVETGRAWASIASALVPVSPPAPTFPADSPQSRLDVVFASPTLTVLPHREVTLDVRDLVAASDHRPVWVDLCVGADSVLAADRGA
ncbi:endonuclease/exonuclease/phosphatase family protein [Nostocoides sp. HKS02]|uniref:endonuclease/exonuclease/phosphatase family protein n=1 Tax=Nostocoides sp. HKS02 TaxID=1813880 RepID=UPI0012B44751|nr:endonuclease/exonuclease/phosphatase family protein [Tetrasphaera sp. HKS02]QGN57559.1 hypothetical protein GKE56_06375 [Tetrasphaera sp. HKS02]